MGVVSPRGTGTPAFAEALTAGRSGVRRLEMETPRPLATRIGAPVAGFDAASRFPAARSRMLDRVSQLALTAANEAVASSCGALEGADPTAGGVFVGTGMGGAQSTDDNYRTLYAEQSDRVKPFSVLLAMSNAPCAWIALEHGLSGPSISYSSACASSAVAIGEAYRRVASGECVVAIAGGAEAPLTFGTIRAWEALRTLAAEDPADPSASCKPFARDRSGLVLGEGAAMLVLEDRERALARGASIVAEIVGYGVCTDTSHITRPSVAAQARAMRLALEGAGLDPAQVGYVNAHGTGTEANDGVETAAIREALGSHAGRTPVSSTKSMHGHLLGAAGAMELVAALLALRSHVLPPTMHLANPDPACDLDYVANASRRVSPFEAVLSNSFAFGGTNAVLAARLS
ncbi:MAG TPA: beta-ketoacyl-[acyl-carrier-protein] synthase family protein, partial [Usitatibacter sp.]|jgi:3-oxoacyl-[acyl-carrier-protein] synthase II|nr:beta-ketoacyl-[acyl-carrier-protein] synthase family protein [Usitatibacter sp.]